MILFFLANGQTIIVRPPHATQNLNIGWLTRSSASPIPSPTSPFPIPWQWQENSLGERRNILVFLSGIELDDIVS